MNTWRKRLLMIGERSLQSVKQINVQWLHCAPSSHVQYTCLNHLNDLITQDILI